MSAPEPAPMSTTTVADLGDLDLQAIFVRLAPADILRAALACRRWLGVAVRAIPPVPPLLGYFFHPKDPATASSDKNGSRYPAVFVPVVDNSEDSSATRLSLDLTPRDDGTFFIQDVHLGLVLLVPRPRVRGLSRVPQILTVDPAPRRQCRFSAPDIPGIPLPSSEEGGRGRYGWYNTSYVIGAAVLRRAHPSRLTFDAVVLILDRGLLRALVLSVSNGKSAVWEPLPRAKGVVVAFDPWCIDEHCVHAAGNIYWHIRDSGHVLQLDPGTMDISFMTVPASLADGEDGRVRKYRIGETPEDGRLCIASIVPDVENLQIWVRGEDGKWTLQREIFLTGLFDTALPEPRMILLSDMDYARTGKVFINAHVYGKYPIPPHSMRYSFNLVTGKLERLVMQDEKELGDPIYAYVLGWPPRFLPAPAN